MTGRAERIIAAHRGKSIAAPASASRMAALDSFGLRYKRIDDFNVVVEGEYQLNLAMSFWRSHDGTSQGYLISALDAEIKRRRSLLERLTADIPPGARVLVIDTLNSNFQKPAASRDSVASPQLSSGTSEIGIAEFAAGPISSSLPLVNQWP